jgi:hypothetical protein
VREGGADGARARAYSHVTRQSSATCNHPHSAWQVLELGSHVSPDVTQCGDASNTMAELLMLWGRYDEAEVHLRRALGIRCATSSAPKPLLTIFQ